MTQQPKQYNLTVIGCGKMGTAMIHGWLNAGLINSTEILDPYDIDESLTSHPDLFHVKLMESLSLEKSNIIIMAVKPQIMDDVSASLKNILADNIPILSIAAGKSTSYFQERLSSNTPIIRAMPNTPAAIGKGISAIYATDTVTEDQRLIAQQLLDAVGQTIWLNDESQMDAVTAVSGSGPAYVFYLIEAMAQAGEKAGLSKDHAMTLARQTIIGAAALAESEPETDASVLRQNVTSPGGTTEAALEVLMKGDFQNILTKAIAVAKKRGQDLNN